MVPRSRLRPTLCPRTAAPVPHGTRTDLCVHNPFAGDSEINAVMGWDVLFTTLFTLIFTLTKALHTNTDKIDMHMVSLYTTLLGASRIYTHAIGLCWMYACACACGAALSHPHPRHTHIASPTLYPPLPSPSSRLISSTCATGLCCMPWIVFVIPGVGPIIHQMRPTGFDEVANQVE